MDNINPAVCYSCGELFTPINEETFENRCIHCQANFRLAEANEMHRIGIQHFRMDYRTGKMVDTRRFSAFGPISD